MKLDNYLKENQLSLARFAKAANLSAATVMRARDFICVPSLRTMEQIEAATGGQVTRVDLISASEMKPVKERSTST